MQPTIVEKHSIPPNTFTLGLLAEELSVKQPVTRWFVCAFVVFFNSSVEERNSMVDDYKMIIVRDL